MLRVTKNCHTIKFAITARIGYSSLCLKFRDTYPLSMISNVFLVKIMFCYNNYKMKWLGRCNTTIGSTTLIPVPSLPRVEHRSLMVSINEHRFDLSYAVIPYDSFDTFSSVKCFLCSAFSNYIRSTMGKKAFTEFGHVFYFQSESDHFSFNRHARIFLFIFMF